MRKFVVGMSHSVVLRWPWADVKYKRDVSVGEARGYYIPLTGPTGGRNADLRSKTGRINVSTPPQTFNLLPILPHRRSYQQL